MSTLVELKAQAKAKGLKGYSTMRKAELMTALGHQLSNDDHVVSIAKQLKIKGRSTMNKRQLMEQINKHTSSSVERIKTTTAVQPVQQTVNIPIVQSKVKDLSKQKHIADQQQLIAQLSSQIAKLSNNTENTVMHTPVIPQPNQFVPKTNQIGSGAVNPQDPHQIYNISTVEPTLPVVEKPDQVQPTVVLKQPSPLDDIKSLLSYIQGKSSNLLYEHEPDIFNGETEVQVPKVTFNPNNTRGVELGDSAGVLITHKKAENVSAGDSVLIDRPPNDRINEERDNGGGKNASGGPIVPNPTRKSHYIGLSSDGPQTVASGVDLVPAPFVDWSFDPRMYYGYNTGYGYYIRQ